MGLVRHPFICSRRCHRNCKLSSASQSLHHRFFQAVPQALSGRLLLHSIGCDDHLFAWAWPTCLWRVSGDECLVSGLHAAVSVSHSRYPFHSSCCDIAVVGQSHRAIDDPSLCPLVGVPAWSAEISWRSRCGLGWGRSSSPLPSARFSLGISNENAAEALSVRWCKGDTAPHQNPIAGTAAATPH